MVQLNTDMLTMQARKNRVLRKLSHKARWLGFALVSLALLSGCLERQFLLRWDARQPVELQMHWNGDSTDIMTGMLPNFGAEWRFTEPIASKDENSAGKFEQSGLWKDPLPMGQKFSLLSPSAVSPELILKKYWLGPVSVRTMNGVISGASLLPFSDPDEGAPESPIDSIKRNGLPMPAALQESLETVHAWQVLAFRTDVFKKTLMQLSDSLHMKFNSKAEQEQWAQRIADQWKSTFRQDLPQATDLDFWSYAADSIFPHALPTDRVMSGEKFWNSLKEVHDTYRDLEDESVGFVAIVAGWKVNSNADSTHGDTLVWKWEGADLRAGGPYRFHAAAMVFEPMGAIISGIILMILAMLIRMFLRKKSAR